LLSSFSFFCSPRFFSISSPFCFWSSCSVSIFFSVPYCPHAFSSYSSSFHKRQDCLDGGSGLCHHWTTHKSVDPNMRHAVQYRECLRDAVPTS
jgi:hypothetical protein